MPLPAVKQLVYSMTSVRAIVQPFLYQIRMVGLSVAYLLLVTVLPLPVITHSALSFLCRLYVILVTMCIVSCMASAIDFMLVVFVNILECVLK